jgi:hypothetical protein
MFLMNTMSESFNVLTAKASQSMQALNPYLPLIKRWILGCLLVLLSLTIDLWTALVPVVDKWLSALHKSVTSAVQSVSSVQTPSEPVS